jgi:hypothetical protein
LIAARERTPTASQYKPFSLTIPMLLTNHSEG